MRFDFTLIRVVITVVENYKLDFSDGDFADLIGFEKEIFKDEERFVRAKMPDISRSIHWVFIHCDLITRQANDV